ncbi:MAG: hypothetical protein JW895_15025, partial [Thermoleophilaceae bacterium]|nr:hypothetical protein [Thermoleophilaceae bacterium]
RRVGGLAASELDAVLADLEAWVNLDTPSYDVAALDAFAEVLADILREGAEDPEIARNAPYTTPVRRLDEAGAAKRPVVRQGMGANPGDPDRAKDRPASATGAL